MAFLTEFIRTIENLKKIILTMIIIVIIIFSNNNNSNNNNNNNNNNIKIFKSKRFQLTNCGMIYQCTF